jgi:hypothetical protein
MKVLCRTLFDCTRTGVTGHFRAPELPFQDRAGQTVATYQDWTRSRNQQRNYETLLQLFGLRTQPQEISEPQCNHGEWSFTFESENENVFAQDGNPDNLASLKQDCSGIPMMTGLNEKHQVESVLNPNPGKENIWFELVNS